MTLQVVPGMRSLEGGSNKGYWVLNSGQTLFRRSVEDYITLLDDPQNFALLALLQAGLLKVHVPGPKFEWHEDEIHQRYVTLTSADASSGDTTITVSATEAALMRTFDVWMVSDSAELLLVNGKSGTTIYVTRGAGYDATNGTGVPAATLSTGDILYYIGNAMEVGSNARERLTTQAVGMFGYNQVFQEAVQTAEETEKTSLYGGSDMRFLRRKHGGIHMQDKERAFWFNQRNRLDYDDIDANVQATYGVGNSIYLTDGVFNRLSTNTYVNLSGALTWREFSGQMPTAFRYGNKVKTMFTSPAAHTVIDDWSVQAVQTAPETTLYGMAIKRLRTSDGELNLVTNKLFYDLNQDSGLSDRSPFNYTTCSVILDLPMLRYMYQTDVELRMNRQANESHSRMDEFYTCCGLKLKEERHHMEIFGWDVP